ncbi:MAG TPA: penicillin-binding transpeptidase domain-containing protein [Steroidobacteraceae bacterium]|nr:penicillin-binding transpeptidase domain-containing protein [Steroidobacteraceae bacterium]
MKWKRTEAQSAARQFRLRGWWVLAALALGAVAIVVRAVDLQVLKHGFLAEQGAERFMRNAKIPAHRGAIVDRFGEPLAVSTPVDTVWTIPSELAAAPDQLPRLARALSRDREWLIRRVTSNLESQYLVLAKQLQPDEAARVKALDIPGVYLQREYRRFYPAGEVTGHLLGFTGAEDQGQEGLELAYEQKLAGEDGIKRVIQDRLGRVVENVDSVRAPRPGEELVTSVDLRIQYLAYRELKSAIRDFQARAGSVIVIDVWTGEVLAMVNQPSFNPNDRAQFEVARYRNRAATDIFEPGSSIKPFIVATGLASGQLTSNTIIDTSPGFIKVGTKVIEDEHNLGAVDVATILAKSSNVGMAHIALSLDRAAIWGTLNSLGFGQVSASGFPGESAGLLTHYSHWRDISVATIAHGYGVSVTPLQLAQAYATIGALGVRRPMTFRRQEGPVAGERVLEAQVCRDLIRLLESVVTPAGTGIHAAVRGYRVAGKTGTAWKSIAGGYSTDKYMAVFGGLVPAAAPRLAAVVVIDEPSGGKYYGGDVAAPVFSSVVAGALRLLAVPPDDLSNVPSATLVQAVSPR